MSSRTSGGQAEREVRKVPAAQARRRSQFAVTSCLAGLAAVWVVPALLLRPLADPAGLAFATGIVVGLGAVLVRHSASIWSRGSRRLLTMSSRFLTVRTWTGPRTIDLRDLRRIRARRFVGRASIVNYVTVTDTAGVRIAVPDDDDDAIRLIRRALAEQARQQPERVPVKISPLAADVLGIRPLPWWVSPAWTMAAVELPVMIMFACVFTVMPLASA